MDSQNAQQRNMEVFKTIAELIASSEFQDASFQYLDQHKDVFSDGDENKLEYTIIFENYVAILDTVIDSKLYARYNEQVINQFYMDFKDGYKKYESVDAEAVETLFGFTDFNRFKKQVLEFKAGIGITGLNKEKESQNIDYSQKGEAYFLKVIGESLADSALGWKKRLDHTEKNIDLQVHQRPSEGDDHMARVDVKLRGISMETLKEFMGDIDTQMADMADGSNVMREINVLEKSANSMPAAMRIVLKLPLMNEREMVLKTLFQDQDDGKFLVLFHSYERDDCPIKPDRIRINMFRGMLWWPEGDGIKSVHLQQANFKGYFPMRLMNMAIGKAIKKQIQDVMYPKLLKLEQAKQKK